MQLYLAWEGDMYAALTGRPWVIMDEEGNTIRASQAPGFRPEDVPNPPDPVLCFRTREQAERMAGRILGRRQRKG